jgi:hypothetical protein
MQALTRAGFINTEVEAKVAVAGIDKPKQDKRTQVAGVRRAQSREAEPNPAEAMHFAKPGSSARLRGQPRQKRGQWRSSQPCRRTQNEMPHRQPKWQLISLERRRRGWVHAKWGAGEDRLRERDK